MSIKPHRLTKVTCTNCGGTGKVALCAFCEGPPDDRNEADGMCESCKKPVCLDHQDFRWEDFRMCHDCGTAEAGKEEHAD